MRHIFLTFYALFFCVFASFAQSESGEVYLTLDSVDSRIRAVLLKNEQFVKSIYIYVPDVIKVHFGDENFTHVMTFYQEDSIIKADKYALMLFQSLSASQLPIADTTKMKEEVLMFTDELEILSFDNNEGGKYIDHCFRNYPDGKSDFTMILVLCDRVNVTTELSVMWPFEELINIEIFEFPKKVELHIGLCGDNIGLKKENNHLPWIDRYRLLLFDIKTSELVSSQIICSRR